MTEYGIEPRDRKSASSEAKDKDISKVVTGEVKIEKKGFGQKMSDVFFNSDAKTVGEGIVYDILVPVAKETLRDVVSNALDMFLFGRSSGRSSGYSSGGSRRETRVSYDSYYRSRNSNDGPKDDVGYVRMNRFDYDNVIVETRWEAEEIRDKILEIADRYGCASVADFHDILGISGSYTENKYGWTRGNIAYSDIRIRKVRDGYSVSMPAPERLD